VMVDWKALDPVDQSDSLCRSAEWVSSSHSRNARDTTNQEKPVIILDPVYLVEEE